MDKTLNVALTPQQINYILGVLADRPWREADNTIRSLAQQANEQQPVEQTQQTGQQLLTE